MNRDFEYMSEPFLLITVRTFLKLQMFEDRNINNYFLKLNDYEKYIESISQKK